MNKITVETLIVSDIDTVWDCWNNPSHITQWAFASPDWEASSAENDLQVGGKFSTRMAAKDGSAAFDFAGVYTEVVPKEKIVSVMGDDRSIAVEFQVQDGGFVKVVEEFDMESENSEEMQRAGWQAILDNFKKHVENHS